MPRCGKSGYRESVSWTGSMTGGALGRFPTASTRRNGNGSRRNTTTEIDGWAARVSAVSLQRPPLRARVGEGIIRPPVFNAHAMTRADGLDLPMPHSIELTVMAADIDAYQHVNNTVYVAWCDRSAWE